MSFTTLLTKVESSDVIFNESLTCCPHAVQAIDKNRITNNVLIKEERKNLAYARLSVS